MPPHPKLLEFFRREFETEEKSGFARLSRVPDSYVRQKLEIYRSLDERDRIAFVDCCAHWACASYGFVIGAPQFDHTAHPFFERWKALGPSGVEMSVPLLRSTVQEYKFAKHWGRESHVTREQFEYACSIRSVKAPEMRKRAIDALEPLGYYEKDDLGYYHCRKNGHEFLVHVDCRSLIYQFRYVVSRPEFKKRHPVTQFVFESALGMGFGNWNYIVEENVDDVFALFPELVAYSYELPDRIRAAVGLKRKKKEIKSDRK